MWHIQKRVDINAMKLAANHLVGYHDFSSFRSTSCQAPSPIKTIDKFCSVGKSKLVKDNVVVQTMRYMELLKELKKSGSKNKKVI